MKKHSILTLALLVLFSPALGLLARDGAPQEQLVGKVESVKGDQLTLLPADGKSVLIRLTADTLYTSGKTPATRTDVKAGRRARVTVNRDGETLSAQATSRSPLALRQINASDSTVTVLFMVPNAFGTQFRTSSDALPPSDSQHHWPSTTNLYS